MFITKLLIIIKLKILYIFKNRRVVLFMYLRTEEKVKSNISKCCIQLLWVFSFFFFLVLFIYLLLFLAVWLGLRCCMWTFLQLRRAEAILCCGARASHRGGFSCCGAWALGMQASVVAARGSVVVAHGLSSCGTQAQLLHGMWDLPRAGIEPVSPALAGGFLTTAPPGKSHRYFLCSSFFIFQIFHSEFVMIIRNIVICIFKKETHITILSSTTLAACGMEFHLFIRFIFQTRSYALLWLLPSHFPCLKSFCFC